MKRFELILQATEYGLNSSFFVTLMAGADRPTEKLQRNWIKGANVLKGHPGDVVTTPSWKGEANYAKTLKYDMSGKKWGSKEFRGV